MKILSPKLTSLLRVAILCSLYTQLRGDFDESREVAKHHRRAISPLRKTNDPEDLEEEGNLREIPHGEPTAENVTAQLGSSVFLACKTHHSMERQVSWVRRRDWHILTSGTLPYTKEERFVVHHPEGSTEWTLEIKYVQLLDEGTYECQIATGGGILSHLIHLNVVAPKAVIPGNGEYHVETGSPITLDCIIEQSPVAPQFIFWFHDNRMINYDTERGGVTVNINIGPPKVRSRLTVTDARPTDSGNYTCAAANTASASIMVYITEANNIAVIQPRASDDGGMRLQITQCLLLLNIAAQFLFNTISLRASSCNGRR